MRVSPDAQSNRKGASETTTEASVKSAERVLVILELLTSADRPMSFHEIGRVLGYPRSSLHGLLHTMSERHWLEEVGPSRSYGLGIRAWEAGCTYLRAISLAERALPVMGRLRDRLDETVQLAILDGRYNVYIAKAAGSQRLVLVSEVGRRLEAHATGLGKVLLAGLPPEQLDTLFSGVTLERFSHNTICGLDALKEELAAIRRRGYGTDNEEYTLGVRCVAVPVRDSSGTVIASMSVSVPTVRDAVLRKEGPRLLLEAAKELSEALGYRPRWETSLGGVASSAALP